MELDTFFVGLLLKGPAWSARESPELARLQHEHVAYKQGLVASGMAVAAGPITGDGDLRGLTVYRTATLEEARALADDDPAVRAGRFVVELHTWLMPKGTLPTSAAGR